MEGNRVFHARISEFDSMMTWIREVIAQVKSDPSKSKKFEIAIEEVLMNIIHYAYSHPPGLVEITYSYSNDSNKIEFIFKDKGKPFNPLTDGKSIDPKAPIHERSIGGLGVHFIHQLSDRVEYQRIDDSNVLKLSCAI